MFCLMTSINIFFDFVLQNDPNLSNGSSKISYFSRISHCNASLVWHDTSNNKSRNKQTSKKLLQISYYCMFVEKRSYSFIQLLTFRLIQCGLFHFCQIVEWINSLVSLILHICCRHERLLTVIFPHFHCRKKHNTRFKL